MSAKNILDDVRVVELSEALAGPYCAMLLGDFGADVIKIERPGLGDQSRGWGPPFVGSESTYFLGTNRNKRSVALNYDHPQGLEALRKLIAAADIFICNQPSLASLQKRGLDAKTLCGHHPPSSIAASQDTVSRDLKLDAQAMTSSLKRKPE